MLTIFAKHSILDIWHGSKYTFECSAQSALVSLIEECRHQLYDKSFEGFSLKYSIQLKMGY